MRTYCTCQLTVLVVGLFIASGALAADLWLETPNLLNNQPEQRVSTAPTGLNARPPAIELWKETPDLNAARAPEVFDALASPARIVNRFRSEMYAETPNLMALDEPITIERTLPDALLAVERSDGRPWPRVN